MKSGGMAIIWWYQTACLRKLDFLRLNWYNFESRARINHHYGYTLFLKLIHIAENLGIHCLYSAILSSAHTLFSFTEINTLVIFEKIFYLLVLLNTYMFIINKFNRVLINFNQQYIEYRSSRLDCPCPYDWQCCPLWSSDPLMCCLPPYAYLNIESL